MVSAPATIRDYLVSLIDIGNEEVLKPYLDQLIKDTKRAENDWFYANMMRDIYMAYEDNRAFIDENALREFEPDPIYEKTLNGVAAAFHLIPSEQMGQFIVLLESLPKSWLLAPLTEAGKVANKVGGKVVGITLVAVQLSYAVISNMWQWWNGEISGKRCSKNIIDSVASIAGHFKLFEFCAAYSSVLKYRNLIA